MSEQPKRKLIEVALPLEAINAEAAREKDNPFLRGHPRGLHVWWARRPLPACRAVLFASLVDDPSSDQVRFPTRGSQEAERRRLFQIIERLISWDGAADETVLKEARDEISRSTGGDLPPILDPFCGGGSIPLEAQRLGLEAHGSDLNPVAVLITKALIEIPARFAGTAPVNPSASQRVGGVDAWPRSAGLAEDVRRYGAWIASETRKRIGHLYPYARLDREYGGVEAPVLVWLWARTVVCPNPACGGRMPLVRSFTLSAKKGKEARIEPVVDSDTKTVRFLVREGAGRAHAGTVGRSGAQCVICGSAVSLDYVRSEGREGRMSVQLMAMVANAPSGRVFLGPDPEHERVALSAVPEWAPDTNLPDQALGFRVQNYGMTKHRDLFTKRQLVALTTMGDLVAEARERVYRDALAAGHLDDGVGLSEGGVAARAYADAVSVYLAFIVDKATDYFNSLCTWNAGNANVGHLFAKQSLPMVWDFAEASPTSGGLVADELARGIAEILTRLPGRSPGQARQEDATALTVDPGRFLVSTDPPYYDNIGYADVSDYFYVWLRRALGDTFPDLFRTILTPKQEELVATPFRFNGDRNKAEDYFREGLESAFGQLLRASDPDYPVTIYYAFKQAESDGSDGSSGATVSTGWETMLTGLLGAGFIVDGTWPIRTERGARSVSLGTNALASSIVLVCRRRDPHAGITDRRAFIAALKSELPEALRTLQHGNIAPVDLAQASIGPGMAVFSRFAKVLEPDGSPMRVRTALALINQTLDELLTEQEGEFDADTRWAIAWYEQFGLSDSPFGLAETLSKAKNSSVAGLVEAGIVAASRGRVRLLERGEYSANWDPGKDARVPVWEATQRLVHALLTHGEGVAGELLAQLGGLGDTARDLAYRLYLVAERKGWTEEARAYNALVVAWTDLARGAESARAAQPAQTSLGLE